MFRILTDAIGTNNLMELHSADLIGWLESVWNNRSQATVQPPAGAPIQPRTVPAEPGRPYHRSTLLGLSQQWGAHAATQFRIATLNACVPGPIAPTRWNHLIYAYMIESTNMFEIFWTVLKETMLGERLGIPTIQAQWWLRTTEDLFFRTPSPFQISSVRGDLRPDDGATRRNAYHRLFGMELPNTGAAKPPAFLRAESANAEFVTVFEEFMREVWLAITNVGNTSGTNPTDPAKIADLAERLHDMLMARRQFGNLGREEFVAVATASWFHLSVESGFVWPANSSSPVVDFLRAEAFSAEERLAKIAQRTGVPAHARSRSLFEIADAISDLMVEIERGDYNSDNIANVRALYEDAPGATPEKRMRLIIRHWALLTGRDPKAAKVAATAPVEARVNGNGQKAGSPVSSFV